jgi:hypothetical protein
MVSSYAATGVAHPTLSHLAKFSDGSIQITLKPLDQP